MRDAAVLDGSEIVVSPSRFVWQERQKELRLGRRILTLALPDRADPRIIQIAALAVAIFFRLFIVRQPLTGAQIFAAIAAPVVLDVSLNYRRRRAIVAPASALVTGLIIALVLQTSAVWPYPVAGALAILSKHLVRTSGRHVFNPSALGLVVVLLASPHVVFAGTEEWQADALASPVIGVGGLLAAKKAHMLSAVNWFMPVFGILLILTTIGAQLVHGGVQVKHVQEALFVGRFGFIVFAFYLLTDPRTAPRAFSGQKVYAIVIGLLATALAVTGVDRVVSLLLALMFGNALALVYIDGRFQDKKVSKYAELPGPLAVFMRLKDGVRSASRSDKLQEADESEVVPSPVGISLPEMREVSQSHEAAASVGSGGRQEISLPFLVLEESSRRLLMPAEETTVGRAPGNLLRLDAAGVSRQHAKFSRDRGSVILADLGSSNGTFVNGTRISGSVRVQDGDRINFGGTTFGVSMTFRMPELQPAAAPLFGAGA
jgi:Na+-translocating ferredoxin:NAD+ oxidoreductase RnfD subunit